MARRWNAKREHLVCGHRERGYVDYDGERVVTSPVPLCRLEEYEAARMQAELEGERVAPLITLYRDHEMTWSYSRMIYGKLTNYAAMFADARRCLHCEADLKKRQVAQRKRERAERDPLRRTLMRAAYEGDEAATAALKDYDEEHG